MQAKKLGDAGGTFLVSDRCFPQTIEVLRSRAEPLGIALRIVAMAEMAFSGDVFGVLLQYPDEAGALHDLRRFITQAHAAGVLVAVASDLLALAVVTPPGEMGADVVLGNSQRLGVPLGCGNIGMPVDQPRRDVMELPSRKRAAYRRKQAQADGIQAAVQGWLAAPDAMPATMHAPAPMQVRPPEGSSPMAA